MPARIPAPSDVAAPPADAERTAAGLASKVIRTGSRPVRRTGRTGRSRPGTGAGRGGATQNAGSTKNGPNRAVAPGPAPRFAPERSAQFAGQSTPWLFSPSAPAGTGPIPL